MSASHVTTLLYVLLAQAEKSREVPHFTAPSDFYSKLYCLIYETYSCSIAHYNYTAKNWHHVSYLMIDLYYTDLGQVVSSY